MIYYTDGFTIGGNPGKVGGGYTIVDEGNNLVEQVTIEKPGMTNNETELLGVLAALKLCSKGDKIITDSENTRAWIKSSNPKARPDLKPLCAEAKELAERKQVVVEWQPRGSNLAGIYNEQKASTETSGAVVDTAKMLLLIQKLREEIRTASSEGA
jgi:ribonuclease HI